MLFPFTAALYQKYWPVPATPAVEATLAVGVPSPHCVLFDAVGAVGDAFTVTGV